MTREMVFGEVVFGELVFGETEAGEIVFGEVEFGVVQVTGEVVLSHPSDMKESSGCGDSEGL